MAVADIDPEQHRAAGIVANNSIWDLVGEPASPERDEELLRRAYAAAYHWQRAARRSPENEIRACYMLSKVHTLVGSPERGLHYADACLAGCVQHGIADFDIAYAHEARARALKALGRTDEAAAAWKTALDTPVADPEDRAIVEADMADGL
jgi:tetratricopeptide (TPR) repeat protein